MVLMVKRNTFADRSMLAQWVQEWCGTVDRTCKIPIHHLPNYRLLRVVYTMKATFENIECAVDVRLHWYNAVKPDAGLTSEAFVKDWLPTGQYGC